MGCRHVSENLVGWKYRRISIQRVKKIELIHKHYMLHLRHVFLLLWLDEFENIGYHELKKSGSTHMKGKSKK